MNKTLEDCLKQVRLFKDTIKQANGITTDAYYCGSKGIYDSHFTIYFNNVEFIKIANWDNNEWMVYINNPFCDCDENGSPIFTEEHPNCQWVFGYYKSLKRALNKAVSIIKKGNYPRPIEIHY